MLFYANNLVIGVLFTLCNTTLQYVRDYVIQISFLFVNAKQALICTLFWQQPWRKMELFSLSIFLPLFSPSAFSLFSPMGIYPSFPLLAGQGGTFQFRLWTPKGRLMNDGTSGMISFSRTELYVQCNCHALVVKFWLHVRRLVIIPYPVWKSPLLLLS